MRRASALLALLAPALAACGTVAPDKRLSYATVQALNPGVDGKWVLEEFPNTQRVERDPSGKIQRISYGVLDPQGKSKTLTLWFDQNEVLQRKVFHQASVGREASRRMQRKPTWLVDVSIGSGNRAAGR